MSEMGTLMKHYPYSFGNGLEPNVAGEILKDLFSLIVKEWSGSKARHQAQNRGGVLLQTAPRQ